MREGAFILVGDDLDNDLKIGFVLIGCSILLFPMMMDLMHIKEKTMKKHTSCFYLQEKTGGLVAEHSICWV